MNTVALWFDGGGQYGFGNVRRSLGLGCFLRNQNLEVDYVPLSSEAAALAKIEMNPRRKAGVIILDVPYLGDAWVREARRWSARILALDFEGNEAPDTVISLQPFRSFPASSKVECGVQFAIIRDEIRTSFFSRTKGDEILVILGGGDQGEFTTQIVEKLTGLPVCLVQGPLARTLEISAPKLRVLVDPPELPRLMASCRWAVTSGGTAMLELLHLEKAVHVVPRTEAEYAFAQRFLEKDAIVGIGIEKLQPPTLRQMASCGLLGRHLVDGKGCERITVEVKRLLS